MASRDTIVWAACSCGLPNQLDREPSTSRRSDRMRYEITGAILGAILFAAVAIVFAKGWLIIPVVVFAVFLGAVAGYRFVK